MSVAILVEVTHARGTPGHKVVLCLPGALGRKATGGSLFFSVPPNIPTRVNHRALCFLFT